MKTIGCKVEDFKYKIFQRLLKKKNISQSDLLRELISKEIEKFLKEFTTVNHVSNVKTNKKEDFGNNKREMVNQEVPKEFESVEKIAKQEMVNQNISEELKKIFQYKTYFDITLGDWLIRYVKNKNVIPSIKSIKQMCKKLTDTEIDLIIKYFTGKGYQLEA